MWQLFDLATADLTTGASATSAGINGLGATQLELLLPGVVVDEANEEDQERQSTTADLVFAQAETWENPF